MRYKHTADDHERSYQIARALIQVGSDGVQGREAVAAFGGLTVKEYRQRQLYKLVRRAVADLTDGRCQLLRSNDHHYRVDNHPLLQDADSSLTILKTIVTKFEELERIHRIEYAGEDSTQFADWAGMLALTAQTSGAVLLRRARQEIEQAA
jgi:hypothetical protein